MNLSIFPLPILRDNYVWIITNVEHHAALVVDPGDGGPVITYLKRQQLTLSGILITHHHWDHTNGVATLREYADVPVFASQSALPHIHLVNDHDVIQPNALFPAYRVLAIPGHTRDHVAYYADGALFCGDTLFAGGCGRLFEGSAEELYASLQKISSLPDDTHIYCAHEYTLRNLEFAQTVEPHNLNIQKRIEQVQVLLAKQQTSLPSLLKDEKDTNPFLRCHVPDIIAAVEKRTGQRMQQPLDVFRALRKMKDTF